MRWVTFYYDIINNHVSALRIHKDKDTALKHFNANYKNFFQLTSQFKAKKLPATYGFPFRKYCGISATAFKKQFGISIDEALKEAESEDKK